MRCEIAATFFETVPKEERKNAKDAYLDDCTYHATLWQALQAYAKECIADSLRGREIEWAEAIATANREMRRLRELFKSSLELGEQDAENADRW